MSFSAAFCLSLIFVINCATIRNVLRCGTKEDLDSSELTSLSRLKTTPTYPILPQRISSGFEKSQITWKITKYPVPESDDVENLRAHIDAATRTAFQLWSSACNLNFFQTNSQTPDISLRFEKRKKHNKYCFQDFATVEFAHYVHKSKNPRLIHINDDVEWTIRRSDSTEDAVNLVFLLAHEIGHVLGFGHNNLTDSIMFKYYYDYNSAATVELSSEDIAAALQRYGPNPFGSDCSVAWKSACQTSSECCKWNSSDYERFESCGDNKFCYCVAPGSSCSGGHRCCDGSVCNGKCPPAAKFNYCQTEITDSCQPGLTCTVDSVSLRLWPWLLYRGRCL